MSVSLLPSSFLPFLSGGDGGGGWEARFHFFFFFSFL